MGENSEMDRLRPLGRPCHWDSQYDRNRVWRSMDLIAQDRTEFVCYASLTSPLEAGLLC